MSNENAGTNSQTPTNNAQPNNLPPYYPIQSNPYPPQYYGHPQQGYYGSYSGPNYYFKPQSVNRRRTHCNELIVILLQAIPLLAALGAIIQAVLNPNSGQARLSLWFAAYLYSNPSESYSPANSGQWWWLSLWVAAFFWGLGYAYLCEWQRFVSIFIGGIFGNLAFPYLVFIVEGIGFEHATIAEATYLLNPDCWIFAILTIAVCTLTIVDAWRLAVINNELVAKQKKQEQATD